MPEDRLTILERRIEELESILDTLRTADAGRFVAASVSNSTAIAIANNTITAVTYDTEAFDTDGFHSTLSDTSRLTAPYTGYYLVGTNLLWTAAAGGRRYVRLRLNGSTIVAGIEIGSAADATGVPTQAVSHVLAMNANDYIETVVLQGSGGDLNINVAVFTPRMWIVKVG